MVFIKIAKQLDGSWFFIDKNGKPFYSVGCTATRYDNRPGYESNVVVKYGSLDAWGTETVRRLKEWGFNTLGCWSLGQTYNKGLPFCPHNIDVGEYAHNHGIPLNRSFLPDCFDARWPALAREGANQVMLHSPWFAPDVINDEQFIGWFISNDFFIARWSPHENPDYNEAMFKGDIDSLLALQADTDPAKARLIELGYDYHQWLREYAELYYSVVCDAIRNVDPNHLILGTRYSAELSIPQEDLEAAGRHVDVISVNFYQYLEYFDDFQTRCRQQLENFHAWSGKPIMITEWSIRSRQCDPDVTNATGAGPIVDTQTERGEYYRKTLLEVGSPGFMVGMHWFMWTDKAVGGENDNFGLVKVNDDPYEFIPVVTQANKDVLALRIPILPIDLPSIGGITLAVVDITLIGYYLAKHFGLI